MSVSPKSFLPQGFIDQPKLRTVGRSMSLAAIVGLVAGLGAAAFDLMGQWVGHYAMSMLMGYHPGGPIHEGHVFTRLNEEYHIVPWLLVLVPTVGGLASGTLVNLFAPEAEGHGTDAVIEAYHNNRGLIRARVPLVKMFASAITLGTGGSGGREGPIAQIGAGFGSILATKLKLSNAERRMLVTAGIGAGIGAIFRAPLAGAIFAIEVLYRDPDFEAEGLIPAFISTTMAYCIYGLVYTLAFGQDTFDPLFAVSPGLSFDRPAQLLPLAVLAMGMAGASMLHCKSFESITQLFHRMPIPKWLKPAIGAMGTGLVALAIYLLAGQLQLGDDFANRGLSVLSSGYGFLQEILSPQNAVPLTIGLLLVVGLGKILTTGLTIGSGGSGGVFGPSMVIGGSLGAVMGLLMNQAMPNLVPQQDVVIFAILGMAGFFAAAANTPVSTLIMVSELTGSYELLLPAMWVCSLSYLVSRRWTLYDKQVANRMESPAHRGDFIIDILQGMSVRDAFTDTNRHIISIPIEMPLREVVQIITDTRQTSFPVLDHAQQYHGMFGLNDVRKFLYDSDLGDLAVAHDLAISVKPLSLDMELGAAIGRFAESNYEELPVIDPADPTDVVGMLRRVDVIAAYNAKLLETRTARQAT